jgi:hypothetical protein
MTFCTKVPAVLTQESGNSLSVERVLRLAYKIIDATPVSAYDSVENEKLVCLEDLDTLIRHIDR